MSVYVMLVVLNVVGLGFVSLPNDGPAEPVAVEWSQVGETQMETNRW